MDDEVIEQLNIINLNLKSIITNQAVLYCKLQLLDKAIEKQEITNVKLNTPS